jgi:DNA-binding response OmpR family regulator
LNYKGGQLPQKNNLPKPRQTLPIYQDQRVVTDSAIDSHIKKQRKKLADLLPAQELLHSVYGAGYRYDPQDRVVD